MTAVILSCAEELDMTASRGWVSLKFCLDVNLAFTKPRMSRPSTGFFLLFLRIVSALFFLHLSSQINFHIVSTATVCFFGWWTNIAGGVSTAAQGRNSRETYVKVEIDLSKSSAIMLDSSTSWRSKPDDSSARSSSYMRKCEFFSSRDGRLCRL